MSRVQHTPPKGNDTVVSETPTDATVSESNQTQTDTTIENITVFGTSTPNTSTIVNPSPGECTQLCNQATDLLRRMQMDSDSGFSAGPSTTIQPGQQNTQLNAFNAAYSMHNYMPPFTGPSNSTTLGPNVSNRNITMVPAHTIRNTVPQTTSMFSTAANSVTTTT